MVTSSAVVGSSAISSAGSHDSAMAIMTRWRMPPDRLCGKSSMRCAGRGDPHQLEHLDRARSCAACGDIAVWARIASTICWPTVWTGLSEVIGSWKIIDILPPRSLRRSSADSRSTSRPPNSTASASTLPGGLGTSPMTESDVTLLPQPDSPTRPTVRPRGTLKLMPSTARNRPRSVAKWVFRPRTSRSVSIRTSNPVPCRRCSDRACAAGRPSSS